MVLNSSEKTFSLRTEGLRMEVFAELFNAIELFIVIEKKTTSFHREHEAYNTATMNFLRYLNK